MRVINQRLEGMAEEVALYDENCSKVSNSANINNNQLGLSYNEKDLDHLERRERQVYRTKLTVAHLGI